MEGWKNIKIKRETGKREKRRGTGNIKGKFISKEKTKEKLEPFKFKNIEKDEQSVKKDREEKWIDVKDERMTTG